MQSNRTEVVESGTLQHSVRYPGAPQDKFPIWFVVIAVGLVAAAIAAWVG